MQTFPSFNFQINTYGQIFISASKWSFADIPAGTYTLQQLGPLSYVIGCDKVPDYRLLTKDFLIQKEFTNVTKFPNGSDQLSDGIRDLHVNDTFGDYVYWCWTSNIDQTDKSNGIMDVYFARGKICKGDVEVEWTKR